METDSGSRIGPGGNLNESIERTREEEEMADNKVVDRARQVVTDAVDSTRAIIDDGLDEARDRFEGREARSVRFGAQAIHRWLAGGQRDAGHVAQSRHALAHFRGLSPVTVRHNQRHWAIVIRNARQ